MKANPILEEIWEIKDRLAAEADYDMNRYFEQLRAWTEAHPHTGSVVHNAVEFHQLIAEEERKRAEEPDLVLNEKPKLEPSERASLKSWEMFARETWKMFTPRSLQVLSLARKEAEQLHDNFVGTEHILLGLIGLGQGVAATVLIEKGLNRDGVRTEIEKSRGKNPEQIIIGIIPYTPRAKRIIERAEKEAESFHHTFVGTEHLLLALLRENEGLTAKLFKNLGLDIEQTRKEIQRELDPNFSSGSEQKQG